MGCQCLAAQRLAVLFLERSYQSSTGFADHREMKPCPIHRALLARWVGDQNGQPIGKSPCCFFSGYSASASHAGPKLAGEQSAQLGAARDQIETGRVECGRMTGQFPYLEAGE